MTSNFRPPGLSSANRIASSPRDAIKGEGIPYLLRDDFTTAAGAPLTSPRTCDPGPGTLTLLQNDGQLSTVSARLNYPAQATPAWGDLGAYSAAGLSRRSGRCLIGMHRYSAVSTGLETIAWFLTAALNTSSIQNIAHATFENNTFIITIISEALGTTIPFAAALATDYMYALWLLPTGCYYCIKGGTYTVWTLLDTDTLNAAATLYPGFSTFNSAGAMDFIHVRDFAPAADSTAALAALTAAYPN